MNRSFSLNLSHYPEKIDYYLQDNISFYGNYQMFALSFKISHPLQYIILGMKSFQYSNIKYLNIRKIFTIKIHLLFAVLWFYCISSPVYSQLTPVDDVPPQLIQSENQNSPAPQVFDIDTGRSILRIYIGRTGLLSSMGHNHIILNRDIVGSISVFPNPLRSTAQLTIPVQKMIVDDTQERKQAGSRYTSIPSESDKSATRTNMLGSVVLDAILFPNIYVDIKTTSIDESNNVFSINLRLKEEQISLELPANYTIDNEKILVDTSFKLNHSDLGLIPYSAIGGMLKVAQEIEFNLHIEAIKR